MSLQVSTYVVSPPVLATSYTLYFFEAVLQLAGMACCNSPPVGKKHPGDLSFKGNEQVFALGHCCCIRHTHTYTHTDSSQPYQHILNSLRIHKANKTKE